MSAQNHEKLTPPTCLCGRIINFDFHSTYKSYLKLLLYKIACSVEQKARFDWQHNLEVVDKRNEHQYALGSFSILKQVFSYKFLQYSFNMLKDAHKVDVIGTHDGAIKKAAWSRDGRYAISAGDDQVIR